MTICAFNFNQRILVIFHLRDWESKHFNIISNMFRALMEVNVFLAFCIYSSAWFLGNLQGPQPKSPPNGGLVTYIGEIPPMNGLKSGFKD